MIERIVFLQDKKIGESTKPVAVGAVVFREDGSLDIEADAKTEIVVLDKDGNEIDIEDKS